MTTARLERRWRPAEIHLAIGGLLAVGVSYGFARYGYGLFLPDIRREFDLSVGTVGFIGSATYAGYLVALLVVAGAARLGPRILVGIGVGSAVVGMGTVALASGTSALVAGLVLAGTSPAWTWAPYSGAVDLVVTPARRRLVVALIPAGTAVATAVVGPLALLVDGTAWRGAWMAMSVVAAAVLVYSAWTLPRRCPAASAVPRVRLPRREGLGWFLRRAAVPLYVTAGSYGVVGAFYWYFATEALTRTAADPVSATAAFWTAIGIAGTAGVLAGPVLARLGLRVSSRLLFLALAVAVALVALAPGSVLASGVSAVVYGPAFMAASSLLALWSHDVFPERPIHGFVAMLLFLGLGTVVGPGALGWLAERTDLRTAFLATAGIALATLCIRAPGRR